MRILNLMLYTVSAKSGFESRLLISKPLVMGMTTEVELPYEDGLEVNLFRTATAC